eukprot:CAMPEP_0118640490 /NCGR_PEP_ID=MMETSP0785-20121206/4782_1 /TAXON_ID=91992 /ORGANISM="Bolidomonas pacifica, Strain CCMP 1866" /LENGTH=1171 /DNA_ID=CAMNT_0006531883 /DNA_START=372 /DNA_END=3887 /DNA_ORIENTATION=-
MVTTIDARTGDLKGLFNSGGKVVTSNTAFPHKNGDSGSSDPSSEPMRAVIDQNINIIPGLDGLIYSLTDSGSLTLLPISAMDVVSTPIASCNHEGEDKDCGMVTGVKKSKVFAIDVEAGSVRWVQSGDGDGGFSRKEAYNWAETREVEDSTDVPDSLKPLLLQREDYLVRQIGITDGEEVWNLTVSHFSALDFETESEDEANWGEHEHYAPPPYANLPKIIWGHDGETIRGVDPVSEKTIWSRKVDTVVAAMYGVVGDKWVDVDIVQEAPPSPSDPSSNENNVVVEYSGDHWAKNAIVLPRVRESGGDKFVEPREWMGLDTDVCVDDSATAAPNAQRSLPSPEGSSFNHYAPSNSDSSISSPQGLFLTWKMVIGLVVFLAWFARIAYVKLKRRWWKKMMNTPVMQQHRESFSPPLMSLSENNAHDKFVVQPLPGSHLLSADTSPSSAHKLSAASRAASMPVLHNDAEDSRRGNSIDATDEHSESLRKMEPLPKELSANSSNPVPPSLDKTGSDQMTGKHPSQSPPQTPLPPQGPETPITEVDGIPLVRYSRYASEFHEKSALGRGGFGTVYRCLNSLDGRDYAVKKIRIESAIGADGKKSLSEKLKKVLREVKILALLDHPNIVRYYTAWLEFDYGDGKEKGGGENAEGGDDQSGWASSSLLFMKKEEKRGKRKKEKKVLASALSSDGSLDDLGFDWDRGGADAGDGGDLTRWSEDADDDDDNDDDGDSFMDLSSQSSIDVTPNNHSGGYVNMSSTNGSRPNDKSMMGGEDSNVKSAANWLGVPSYTANANATKTTNQSNLNETTTQTSTKGGIEKKKMNTQRHILYIQMQYCSQKSLRDFLSSPEARSNGNAGEGGNKKDSTFGIDIPYALELFGQVCRGVKHVHSQGLIHRDLKPSNCFVDVGGQVKIGDFGLSRESSDADESGKEGDPETSFEVDRAALGKGVINTAGVGTYMYASPEQMNGRDYDASTDVYSLGVLLFELCYPMYTGMERSVVLGGIHKGQFPKAWMESVPKDYKELHSLIVKMISHKPQERPTADDVANIIDQILGKLTILSLDRSKSRGDGAVLLRVEAQDAVSILPTTVAMIKKAAPEVIIQQYGLRGHEGEAIMEFAIGGLEFDCGDDSGDESVRKHDSLEKILGALNASNKIGTVRRVTEKHGGSFDGREQI